MDKKEIRCPCCDKKLCELNGSLSIKCPRCKSIVNIAVENGSIKVLSVKK